MSSPDFEEIYTFAISLAREAGALIAAASNSRATSAQGGTAEATKKNRVDLVTETDQRVEKFILESIKAKYPTHAFIGEETYAALPEGETVALTDEVTWIIDPIDGTTNFVHGFPFFCTSIGVTFNKIPVVGVIFNPTLNQLYSAREGHGAWLNESVRLPLSHPGPPPPLHSLSDALIAFEFGSDRSSEAMKLKAENFSRLAGDSTVLGGGVMAHGMRSLGSAALNYATVASGQADLYQEIGCWSWDVCAGTILAREAGGRVFGRGGRDFGPEDLMSHYFFVVRAIGDTPQEKGEDAQRRIAREYFAVVKEWDV